MTRDALCEVFTSLYKCAQLYPLKAPLGAGGSYSPPSSPSAGGGGGGGGARVN
ncbi:hypothetical protein MY1884_003107 [Beauveria asiatica]